MSTGATASVSPFVANTVRKLYADQDSPNLSGTASVLSPSAASIPASAKGYLKSLAGSAQTAAESLGCGSILAGLSSESDDFSDIAFWIPGKVGPPTPDHLLTTLQLDQWNIGANKVVDLSLDSDTGLPSTLGSSKAGEVADLVGLLSKLKHKRAFTVTGGPGFGGAVAYFLVGELGQDGWGGLAGIGIQSDN